MHQNLIKTSKKNKHYHHLFTVSINWKILSWSIDESRVPHDWAHYPWTPDSRTPNHLILLLIPITAPSPTLAAPLHSPISEAQPVARCAPCILFWRLGRRRFGWMRRGRSGDRKLLLWGGSKRRRCRRRGQGGRLGMLLLGLYYLDSLRIELFLSVDY